MLLIEENKFLTSLSPGSRCWCFLLYPSSYNTAATIVLILLLSHWDQTRSPPLLHLKPLQEDCQVPPVISRCSVVTFLVNRGRQTLFYQQHSWSGKREDQVFHALNSHGVFFLTHRRCKNTNNKWSKKKPSAHTFSYFLMLCMWNATVQPTTIWGAGSEWLVA